MRRPRRARRRPARPAHDDPRSGQIPATVLGLDIGGSSSRARLSDGGVAVADVEGPGANVATLPVDVVERRVVELLAKLGEAHPSACCAGAAGAEIAEGRDRLQRILRQELPDCRLAVVHDARLVLAAAGLDAGIALIAGTGSVAYARTRDGREAQRGGWGWMLGDEGAGVWITREAARLVLERTEDGDDVGELGRALVAAAGAGDGWQMVANLHARHEPMQWAALASAVFETADADPGSRALIRRAAAELARRTLEVRAVLDVDGPVVLAGGLLQHQPRLEEAVREALPHLRCVRLDHPPVEGAVRLARELLPRELLPGELLQG